MTIRMPNGVAESGGGEQDSADCARGGVNTLGFRPKFRLYLVRSYLVSPGDEGEH